MYCTGAVEGYGEISDCEPWQVGDTVVTVIAPALSPSFEWPAGITETTVSCSVSRRSANEAGAAFSLVYNQPSAAQIKDKPLLEAKARGSHFGGTKLLVTILNFPRVDDASLVDVVFGNTRAKSVKLVNSNADSTVLTVHHYTVVAWWSNC